MKKKALTVVLTLTMAATMFAGCGDKKTTGTTETTEAVSTEDEKDDQAKADEVAALIDAIYVQERTDERNWYPEKMLTRITLEEIPEMHQRMIL